jgi:hypothetical protein
MSMTASTTVFPIPTSAAVVSTSQVRTNRRRRVSHQAGRALEILGHAIEYLSDEFVYEVGEFTARDSALEAVQLLMSLNRQIYLECPEVPSFGERCGSFLRKHLV